MKKVLFLILSVITLMTGCIKKDELEVYKKLKNQIDNMNSYHLSGTLELLNNETIYSYNVDVSYKKKDNFKVSLKNKNNDHEQIILRNEEGVYVITPSVNKSFKFQSDWPYNNSQAYLLQTIMSDLENDTDRTISKKDDMYILTSKVNYTNNKDLTGQNVYIDKDGEIKKVEIFNAEGINKIVMNFSDIDMKAVYNNDYFKLSSNISSDLTTIKEEKIDDIIYPMYIPTNTSLTNQETVKLESGERVILTFDGENPFMFVQETIKVGEKMDVIPVNGEPVMLGDTVGVMTNYSINWYNNGREYYLASDTLNENDLISVARSIGSVPVIK